MLKLCLGLVVAGNLMVPTASGRSPEMEPLSPQSPMQTQDKTVTINGKVTAVSDAALTVVDEQKIELIIAVDAKTTITKGGRSATPADIKANDAVVVVATKGEGDVLTAKAITVA